MEEIVVEMQIDIEKLYQHPPTYRASLDLLGNVRILIVRACNSLSYIRDECSARGLVVDILALDEQRIARRPYDHPFYTVSRYMKPDAWKNFNNYQHFERRGQAGNEVGSHAWDEIIAAGEYFQTRDNNSSMGPRHRSQVVTNKNERRVPSRRKSDMRHRPVRSGRTRQRSQVKSVD